MDQTAIAKTEGLVTTSELLRESGISPGDLKNWGHKGLLPPCSGYQFKHGRGCRWYYPAWAVERARDIKRMKAEGYSGQQIHEA
ncbi:unnamed protein product, partial [marine sediment metagenome]